jgi:hypothetical protein
VAAREGTGHGWMRLEANINYFCTCCFYGVVRNDLRRAISITRAIIRGAYHAIKTTGTLIVNVQNQSAWLLGWGRIQRKTWRLGPYARVDFIPWSGTLDLASGKQSVAPPSSPHWLINYKGTKAKCHLKKLTCKGSRCSVWGPFPS